MITARTAIETERGIFSVAHHKVDDGDCLTISTGDLGVSGVLVRLHSSCLFGETLGACDCDCGPQLWAALGEMTRAGVVVYMYQEGRGAGISAKIRAMELQRTEHLNTYQAYDRLGLEWDSRSYAAAIGALRDLSVNRNISLISNNPLKRQSLEKAGFVIDRTLSLPYAVNGKAYEYLQIKRDIGRHTLDLSRLEFTNDAPE